MLFNSAHFAIFLPIVAIAFFAIGHRYRWILLLAASYYFYMAWEPLYAVLIAASTLVDYVAGRKICRTDDIKVKRFWLGLSLVVNLGLLIVFKYFNFISGTIEALCGAINIGIECPRTNLLLPVGISFYTFQTLSYTIECYKGRQKQEDNLGIFGLYVAFFPQLVAGPIERPQNLLHQLKEKVELNYDRIVLGAKRIAWGLFKKVVIADRLAILVDTVYNDPASFSGPEYVVATLFFAFQIYCDFSGYSDIAIGAAKILGIDLMENFRSPYFSRSIAEFWRRWHISLSTWFRDYVYIPLGGYKLSIGRRSIALIGVFLISGLWHGANWTFVIWGALHGFYLLASMLSTGLLKKFRRRLNRWPSMYSFLMGLFTFILVNFAWIFFRANSFADAMHIISRLHEGWGNLGPGYFMKFLGVAPGYILLSVLALVALIIFDKIETRGSFWKILDGKSSWVRWLVYYAIVLALLFFGIYEQSAFIYFQF